MDRDGENQQRLTESSHWEIFPRFSPDENSIVVASGYAGQPQADIHIMNVDGSEEHALTTLTGREENPIWSPQGDFIVFQSEHAGNFELYIMAADGSDMRQLTNHPAGDYWPSWTTH